MNSDFLGIHFDVLPARVFQLGIGIEFPFGALINNTRTKTARFATLKVQLIKFQVRITFPIEKPKDFVS